MKLNLAELKNFKLVTLECNIERTNNPFLMVCFNKKKHPTKQGCCTSLILERDPDT